MTEILENIAFWMSVKEDIEEYGKTDKMNFSGFSLEEIATYCDKMIARNEEGLTPALSKGEGVADAQ